MEQTKTRAEITEVINKVARRNEEVRIYHWHKNSGRFPPRRLRSG